MAEARFPYVSANVRVLPGDTLLYPAYRVIQRQGVRIAITGFTTPGAMVWSFTLLKSPVSLSFFGKSVLCFVSGRFTSW